MPIPWRRKKAQLTRSVGAREAARKAISKLAAILVASGLLAALAGAAFQQLAGDVRLEFLQPIGRAYEFQLHNDTPSDKRILSFRIQAPLPQNVVYKVTEDLYATIDEQGRVSLPGGNVSYVPAAEFRELDGQVVEANSSVKFRVPPLSSRSWMTPEAAIVDVYYETASTNALLSAVDKLLAAFDFRAPAKTVRYIVIENHWAVTHSSSLNEAIRVYCRDNDAMARAAVCGGER